MAKKKKKRRRSVHRHEVKAHISHFDLAKAGSSLNLQIYAFDEKIGELEVGRGSLYWYGRSRHKSKRMRMHSVFKCGYPSNVSAAMLTRYRDPLAKH
jgi:hypothetical protein